MAFYTDQITVSNRAQFSRTTRDCLLDNATWNDLNRPDLQNQVLLYKEMVIANMQAKVILSGGDDILFTIDKGTYNKEQVTDIIKYFHSQTGCTMSFGVGENIEFAYLNLMKAKATGEAKIVD